MGNLINSTAKVFPNRSTGYAKPGVVRTSGGRLYVGHYNASGHLEIFRSDNNGQSWTLDETFTDASDYLSMAVDNLDNVYVAYCKGLVAPVDLVVHKRDNGTATWTEILSEEVDMDSQLPFIRFNPTSNYLFLIWYTLDGSNNGTVTWKYSTDYGTSFSTAQEASSTFDNSHLLTSVNAQHQPSSGLIVVHLTRWGAAGRWTINSDGSAGSISGISSLHFSQSYYGASAVYDMNGVIYSIGVTDDSTTVIYRHTTSIGSTSAVLHGNITCGVDGDNNAYFFYTKSADNKCYCRKYTALTETLGDEFAVSEGQGLRPTCEERSLPLSQSLHLTYFSTNE